MASDLQRRSASHMEAAISSSGIPELQDKLNVLWETYLTALDAYTAAQEVLSKTLASGYFSLAQANARRTGGRRYGQDWYDERSKATARATIASGEGVLDLKLEVTEVPVYLKPESSNADESESSQRQPSEVKHERHADGASLTQSAALPTPSPSPEPEDEKQADEQVSPRKQQPDPATWYGLFVSPSLRQSQQVFRSALYQKDGEEPNSKRSSVETAANSARLLRALEVQIRSVRKAIRKAGVSSG